MPEPAGDTQIPVFRVFQDAQGHLPGDRAGEMFSVTRNGVAVPVIVENTTDFSHVYAIQPGDVITYTNGAKPGASGWKGNVLMSDDTATLNETAGSSFTYTVPEKTVYISMYYNE